MAKLPARNLDDDVKAKLRRRARGRGRRTEREERDILRNAVGHEGAPDRPLGTRIKSRFARFGLEEDIPELRGHAARSADLAST